MLAFLDNSPQQVYSSASSEMDSSEGVLPWLNRLKLFADDNDDDDDEGDDDMYTGFAKGYNGVDADGGEATYSTSSPEVRMSSVASGIESSRCGLWLPVISVWAIHSATLFIHSRLWRKLANLCISSEDSVCCNCCGSP